ncbi:putative Transcription factor RfeG [Seiridium unicorne]|uniref:Transcription factor RfeG n=1 Tax=Seiridium unicorne TaxID=138068 RepID=A0ABR2VB30_9PEZI
MSARPARSNQPPPPASNRQNEYFVPRDGIDREVITADVCRYLGNDALVRPGVYESPQTGQVVQGYYITAYRNLTTAMIEDLKADSARWDQERRQQTSRGGGTLASRDSPGVFIQKSNSPIVQYRNSDTHQSRQYYGPTEATAGQYQDNSRDAYDSTPRYPGTGSAGYTGASGGYQAQSYGGNQGGYGQQGYTTSQAQQFSPSPMDVAYPGGAPMAQPGFGQSTADRPYQQMGANLVARGGDTVMSGTYENTYGPGSRDPRIPVTTIAQQGRPTYVTAGPPASAQGFPPTSSAGGFYQTPSASSQFVPSDSRDPFYGRASPAGNPAYGASHDSQYDTTPAPRTSAPPPSTQMATSGSSRHANRDSVERSDRHRDSRHGHRRP